MMKERFAESEFLAGVPEKLGGAICMQVIGWCVDGWNHLFPFSLTRREALESFCGLTPQPPWE